MQQSRNLFQPDEIRLAIGVTAAEATTTPHLVPCLASPQGTAVEKGSAMPRLLTPLGNRARVMDGGTRPLQQFSVSVFL